MGRVTPGEPVYASQTTARTGVTRPTSGRRIRSFKRTQP
jgi:hypothetical protein